ncbi:hypothetical protein RQP46_000798 [Phenoliferia psychrophenolica]
MKRSRSATKLSRQSTVVSESWLEAPKRALDAGHDLIETAATLSNHKILSSSKAWGQITQDSLKLARENLAAGQSKTETVVAVVGGSGAGKSTLINVATEIFYTEDAPYLTIKLKSAEEIVELVLLAVEDLKDLNSDEAKSSILVLSALWPEKFKPKSMTAPRKEDIDGLMKTLRDSLRRDHGMQLGKSLDLESPSVEVLTGYLRQFVQANGDGNPEHRAFWPATAFIQSEHARSCDADILKDGLVLCDLPGLNDSSSLRESTTRAKLAEAKSILLISDSNRVSTDRETSSILKKYGAPLMLSGSIDNVTVVATKAEDFGGTLTSDLVKQLMASSRDLEQAVQPKQLQKLVEAEKELADLDRVVREAKTKLAKHGITRQLLSNDGDAVIMMDEFDPQDEDAKMASYSDSDDDDDSAMEEDDSDELKGIRMALELAQKNLDQAQGHLGALQERLRKKLILARASSIKTTVQDEFYRGLQGLDGERATAQLRTQLEVISVSSRQFEQGQFEISGIPTLRSRLRILATSSRREHAAKLLAGLQKFCLDSRSIVDGIGGPRTSSKIKNQFGAKKRALSSDLKEAEKNKKDVVAARADQACAAIAAAQKHAEDLIVSYFAELAKYRYVDWNVDIQRPFDECVYATADVQFPTHGSQLLPAAFYESVKTAVREFLQLEGLFTQQDLTRELKDLDLQLQQLDRDLLAATQASRQGLAKSLADPKEPWSVNNSLSPTYKKAIGVTVAGGTGVFRSVRSTLDADIKIKAPGLFKAHAATSNSAFRKAADDIDNLSSEFVRKLEESLFAKDTAIIGGLKPASIEDLAEAQRLEQALKTLLDQTERLKTDIEASPYASSASGSSIKITWADYEPSRSSARLAGAKMETD